MEEDTELEEGEAPFAFVPPPQSFHDTDFSYIDEKLQNLLGEQQKQFLTPGGVDAVQLGSKYGGYGSFLPTQVRRPSVLASKPPLALLTESARGRQPSSEGHGENSKAMASTTAAVPGVPENVLKGPSGVNGFTAGNADGVLCTSSGRGPGPIDKADPKKNPPLTLRIKMGCKENEVSKKAVELFFQNELGLGPHPLQSAGDNHGFTLSPEADRSPMSMIRAMTSHRIPLGGLLSPLTQTLDSESARAWLTEASNSRMVSRLPSKVESGPDSVMVDETGGGAMTHNKITSSQWLGRPGVQDAAEARRPHHLEGIPEAGESESRESLSTVKVDRVESALAKNYALSGVENNDIEETCGARKRDGRTFEGKELDTEKYGNTEGSWSDRGDPKSEKQIHAADWNREPQKAVLKESATEKNLKDLSCSLKPTAKTSSRGPNRDAEIKVDRGALEGYGELAKAFRKETHVMKPETKRPQPLNATEDQKGMPCSTSEIRIEKHEGKQSGQNGKVDKGRDLVRERVVVDLKVSRRSSGFEQQKNVGKDAAQQHHKDGDPGGVSIAVPGKVERSTIKELQVGSTRKSKVSAVKEAPRVKPMGKVLPTGVCKQILNDHAYSEKRGEVKHDDSMSDMNVKRLSSPKDGTTSKLEDIVPSANIANQEVADRGRRDVTYSTSRDMAKESKARRRVNKEQTSREVGGRGRESFKKAADFSVMGSSNKASCSAEQLTQPVITAGAEAEFPPLSNAVVVHEDWVLCDACSKWRLCVPWIKVDELPKKWRCKMMTWLPNMNNCKHSEDETTSAVYLLLGVPPPSQGGQLDSLHASQRPTTLSTAVEASFAEELKGPKPNKVGCAKKGFTHKSSPVGIPLVPSLTKADGSSVKCKSLNAVVQQAQDCTMVLTNVSRKGNVSRLTSLPDAKEERPKRVRGCEGQDSRLLKQLSKEDDLTVFMTEDTDSSCKSEPARTTAQICGATNLYARQQQSSAWKEQVSIVSLKDCEAQDSETRAGKNNGHVLEIGYDIHRRKVPTKRKMEGRGHAEELLRVKKSKSDGLNESWFVKDNEGVGRVQEYAGVDSSVRIDLAEGDENRKNRSGSSKKITVNVIRHQELSKTLKLPKRATDVSKISREAANHQSACMLEVVGATDKDPDLAEQNSTVNKLLLGVKDSRRVLGNFGQPDQLNEGKEEGSESEPRNVKKRKVAKTETRDSGLEGGSRKKSILTSDREPMQGSMFTPRHFGGDNGTGECRSQAVIGKTVQNGDVDQSLDQKPQAKTVDVDGHGVSTSTNLRFSKFSSSSKSSASMSRGRGSPIESTVSSSPLRSPEADEGHLGCASFQGLDTPVNMMGNRYPSAMRHSLSRSPKRSLERDGDAQSERSGPLGQSHRSWDDRPRSSEHDHECRGSNRENSSDRGREDRYTSINGGDVFRRSRTARDDERYWVDHRDGRGGTGGYFPERYERLHDDRYREREGSLDRYREVVRDGRYERHKSRDERFRERDRDHDRIQENWVPDRGDERYARDRVAREDWVRPSSRESRLDKLVGSNWMEEGRSSKEHMCEERRSDVRERPEDGNSDGKQDLKLKSPREVGDQGQPDAEGTALQQSNDAKARDPQKQEKIDAKSVPVWQAPSPCRGGMKWEGERRPNRKDVDGGSMRSTGDALPSADSRNTAEVQEIVAGVRTKGVHHCDVSAADPSKRSREHSRGVEVSLQVRKASHVKAVAVSNAQAGKDQDGSGAGHSREHSQAFNAANVATRDGTDLKHSADRLKHLGQEGESTDLYLRAALKFLQAASMLEPVCAEAAKLGEVTQSMNMYHDTAKLCEYCASSYERGGARNLPAAALAYKCAAVAHMRVLMAKNLCFTRDHQQLHASIQASSLGVNQSAQLGAMRAAPAYMGTENAALPASNGVEESPSSSSASDVDNLNINNQSLVGDKGTCIDKGSAADLPMPMSNSFAVPAQLQQSLTRLLRDASDVSASLDALSKAATATAAADLACAGNPAKLEAMTAVKRVGEDSGFGDVDHVVRLVRLALEAIEH